MTAGFLLLQSAFGTAALAREELAVLAWFEHRRWVVRLRGRR